MNRSVRFREQDLSWAEGEVPLSFLTTVTYVCIFFLLYAASCVRFLFSVLLVSLFPQVGRYQLR